jgi:prevent-host-death family protein
MQVGQSQGIAAGSGPLRSRGPRPDSAPGDPSRMYTPVRQGYNWAVTTIAISQARAEFADVVQRASSGEEITLTSRGVAKARLVPVEQQVRPRTLTRRQLAAVLDGGQMDPAAWDDINAQPGGTIGEDGLG